MATNARLKQSPPPGPTPSPPPQPPPPAAKPPRMSGMYDSSINRNPDTAEKPERSAPLNMSNQHHTYNSSQNPQYNQHSASPAPIHHPHQLTHQPSNTYNQPLDAYPTPPGRYAPPQPGAYPRPLRGLPSTRKRKPAHPAGHPRSVPAGRSWPHPLLHLAARRHPPTHQTGLRDRPHGPILGSEAPGQACRERKTQSW